MTPPPDPPADALDLRSLALVRVGVGAVSLADLWIRVGDFTRHYGEAGWLPREALALVPERAWSWSLYELSGEPAYIGALFAAHALAAAAYLVGYRTRAAGLALWLMTLNLQARNPMVLDGADMLLRHLIFWGLFLPMGARASVDMVRDPGLARLGDRVRGPAALAMALLPAWLYLFAGLSKWGPMWWPEGRAVEVIAHMDQLAKAPLIALRGSPGTLRFLTYAGLAFEVAVPFLLFWPWRRARVRGWTLLALGGFQLALGAGIRLMLFPWLSTLAAAVLIPSQAWDAAGIRALPRDEGAFAPDPGPPVSRGAQVLSGGLAAYVLYWNLAGLPGSRLPFPEPARRLGWLLRLEQRWHLFAEPLEDDGWVVIEGTLADGRLVSLPSGRPLDLSKPPSTYAMFDSHRTWAHYRFLGFRGTRGLRRFTLASLARESGLDRRLVRVRMLFVLERTLPGNRIAPTRTLVMADLVRGGASEPAARGARPAGRRGAGP